MKPFRERNPIAVGAVGLTVTAGLLTAAFSLDKIPFFAGTAYHADFTDASGLKPGDEVRVAGVKVGKVTGVELDGDHVNVDFQVSNAELGSRTSAEIKVRTILGLKFLSLNSAGEGELDPGATIPLDRTTAAFDIVEVFTQLGDTVGQIDTEQLAKSFTVLADTFRDSPQNVQASLDGLSRLSNTIASRDKELASLLQSARGVTQTLADRNDEFQKLIADSNLLLTELRNRREVIHQLLVNTTTLSQQLQGLVADNQAALRPALQQLDGVVQILKRNEASLSSGLSELGPFVRLFANALGTGRWFDTYVVNLTSPFTAPTLPVPLTGVGQ